MIDKARAREVFLKYAGRYDPQNEMIRLKIEHTLRVAELAEGIAASLETSTKSDSGLSWLLGLLHDIGRFEQVRQYGTFVDSISVDHAELSADILFHEGLIQAFPLQALTQTEFSIIETAIRAHNKLILPPGLDDRTRKFCDLLRDADKVDIFRVVSEASFATRVGSGVSHFSEADEASPAVMDCVYRHCCVPRDIRLSRFDGHLSHCCMAFELVYNESRRMAARQGWLSLMLRGLSPDGQPMWNSRQLEQLAVVRGEIVKAWGFTPDENTRY